jgi:HAMP domain-containing protein
LKGHAVLSFKGTCALVAIIYFVAAVCAWALNFAILQPLIEAIRV